MISFDPRLLKERRKEGSGGLTLSYGLCSSRLIGPPFRGRERGGEGRGGYQLKIPPNFFSSLSRPSVSFLRGGGLNGGGGSAVGGDSSSMASTKSSMAAATASAATASASASSASMHHHHHAVAAHHHAAAAAAAMQFPLTNRRKRRVLFTQAQVRTYQTMNLLSQFTCPRSDRWRR